MPTIKLTALGGLEPSVEARALPDYHCRKSPMRFWKLMFAWLEQVEALL